MKHYCYVRGAAGITKVEVVPGVRNDRAVEITSGLHEGEQVLSHPAATLRSLPAGAK
jgi:multidrug efflux pump subunit AcrA (membrane-fusion protein)